MKFNMRGQKADETEFRRAMKRVWNAGHVGSKVSVREV